MPQKDDNQPYESRKYPETFGKIHLMDLPKCGAKRRGKGLLCKAPAMANGRCRLHGGLSTGPKTPEGLARSRRGNWKHGEYSQESKADLRDINKGLGLVLHPERLESLSLDEIKEQYLALMRINARLAKERALFEKRKPAL